MNFKLNNRSKLIDFESEENVIKMNRNPQQEIYFENGSKCINIQLISMFSQLKLFVRKYQLKHTLCPKLNSLKYMNIL